MSDFHSQPTRHFAQKECRCVWCYYPIPVGERCVLQTGFFERNAYFNLYHAECFQTLDDDDRDGFMPGSGDPPARILELTKGKA